MAVDKSEKKMVFTTISVNDATDRINDGIVVKRYQNPWLKSEVGIKRSGVIFRMTPDELQEYVKCAQDVFYFAETYCKVKTSDGSIDNIKLRDYQMEMLKNLTNNRYNIIMASRQCGKTISTSIFMLHFILFNNDKNIMIVANKGDTSTEIIDKIKSIYSLLPFYMKPGVKVWNQRSITFDNGCKIKTATRTKSPAVGFTIDYLYLDEFAKIPSTIIEPYYTTVYPVVTAIENSKITITSTPDGMNLFHKILTDAERPDGDPLKNNFRPMRIYWYQVPDRFVTYIRLNDHKLYEYGVTREYIYELINNNWSKVTKAKMVFNKDKEKYIITVHNNEHCSSDDIKKTIFIDRNGHEVSILAVAELTTWKDEAIKDIGGEDAFNQEYGLRFINSSRSLLDEAIIDNLLKNKKNYIFEKIYEFDKKLRFSYEDLKWIDDIDVFLPLKRKDYKIIISVDISEGLGQDYSVINIFKISEKPMDLIEEQKIKYKSIVDFFRLEQIGIFRNNYVSVKQLAEILYMIVFEYLNPENVKVVVELNNYGNTLLAELPHVFDGNNNYGSSVFVRYKHRVDSAEEKIGLKVGENKNMMVKDYQDLMQNKGFIITNEDNIREITTFVKHVTNAGNIRYAADVGHDDCVMTIVNSTTVFGRYDFREMVEEWSSKFVDKEFMTYVQQCLSSSDYVQGVDYGQVLRIRKQNSVKVKNDGTSTMGINWFGANRNL